MTVRDVIGVTAQDVLAGVQAAVEGALPALLQQIAAAGGPTLASPTGLQLPEPTVLAAAAAELPALGYTSPGTATVARNGTAYDLTWTVLVHIYCRGEDYASTALAVRTYVNAVALAALSDRSANGTADAVNLEAFDLAAYDDPTTDAARTLGAGYVELSVHVAGAFDTATSPALAGWPVAVVETTQWDVQQEGGT